MQYLGGKSRIAKQISGIINNFSKDRMFISPFCGSLAVESRIVSSSKLIGDSHKYLIELYKSIQDGWIIPNAISEEEYNYIKINQDENPPMTGFVGFACSFGGKWFGGYARSKNEPDKNYAMYSRNSLLKKISRMGDVNYYCSSYENISSNNLLNSVVYCDPPYKGTTKYSNSQTFDHAKFWEWVRKSQQLSDIIFVSEYNAPSDFLCVWKKEQKTKVDSRNIEKMFSNIDKLFIHETKLEYYKKITGENPCPQITQF